MLSLKPVSFTTLLAFACAVLTLGAINAGQQARGSIRGRVTIDGGGPLNKIDVRLYIEGTGIPVQSVKPDSGGAFAFDDLPPRPYRVGVFAPGYVVVRPSPAETVRIGDQIELHLTRGGVITGRVFGEDGTSVISAQVSAQRIRDEADNPVTNNQLSSPAWTDDRGIYRIFGLRAGVYLVVVNFSRISTGGAAAYEEYLPVYYPASSRAEAGEVRVAAGSEAAGIDIRYVRARGHSISGTIEAQYDLKRDGSSALSVVLIQYPGGNAIGSGAVNVMGGSREFVIRGVSDGEYQLRANGRLNPNEMLTGPLRRVTVSGRDVTGIKLTALPYGAIVGRIVVESPTPAIAEACRTRPAGSVGEIVVRPGRLPKPDDAGLPFYYSFQGIPVEQGAFTLRNLHAGDYRLNITLQGERWYVRDLTGEVVRGRGFPVNFNRHPLRVNYGETLVGLKVTLSEGAASVAGRVELQQPGERYRIHLVPAEQSAGDNVTRYYEVITNREGRYGLGNLAPGRYRLLAQRIVEPESTARIPAAWDENERVRLRALAQSAGREVVLHSCRDVRELTWK